MQRSSILFFQSSLVNLQFTVPRTVAYSMSSKYVRVLFIEMKIFEDHDPALSKMTWPELLKAQNAPCTTPSILCTHSFIFIQNNHFRPSCLCRWTSVTMAHYWHSLLQKKRKIPWSPDCPLFNFFNRCICSPDYFIYPFSYCTERADGIFFNWDR